MNILALSKELLLELSIIGTGKIPFYQKSKECPWTVNDIVFAEFLAHNVSGFDFFEHFLAFTSIS